MRPPLVALWLGVACATSWQTDGAPRLLPSPADWGTVLPGAEVARPVALRNETEVPWTVADLVIIGPDEGLWIAGAPPPDLELPPGGSLDLLFTFHAPMDDGTWSASAEIVVVPVHENVGCLGSHASSRTLVLDLSARTDDWEEPPSDADADGLLDSGEPAVGLDPTDADTDDDGLRDGVDGTSDHDGDGLIDALDGDSDGDGLLDSVEASALAGPGTNTSSPHWREDADRDSSTDEDDPDTDGDGLGDGQEDRDQDGRRDLGELDPWVADSDGDALPDGTDGLGFPSVIACTDPLDADTDDDGLKDGAEDGDHDGMVTGDETGPCASDSDGDGLLDGLEEGVFVPPSLDTDPLAFRGDHDPSTQTNPLSSDTDGGGAMDGDEDADHDGQVDGGERNPNDPGDDVDPDSDGDGLLDPAELPLGLDPNNPDTDGDGVADGADGTDDTDGDGLLDALDLDSDGDGLGDGLELGLVPDADPLSTTDPDVIDSDGDGLGDGEEDLDADGAVGVGESDPQVPDWDGDGLLDGDPWEPDPLDPDSDDDGLEDGTELIRGLDNTDDDSDDDGLTDGSEDGLGTDPLVLDSDEDGLGDGQELGLDEPDGEDSDPLVFLADLDPTTTTDPTMADTDGGGVGDGAEDEDLDGLVDPGERDPTDPFDDGLVDLDEDLFWSQVSGGDDCDDLDPAVHPGGAEGCDNVDGDCDGDLVEGAPDLDGDGLPDCVDPDDDGDLDPDGTDCAPGDPGLHAGAPEFCDDVDTDCDGDLADGAPDTDADGDPDCIDDDDDNDEDPDATDCAPLLAAIHQGAVEDCDNIDSDCDLSYVDDALNTDGDGLPDCVDPDDDEDGEPDGTDCRPTDPFVSPLAVDIPDDSIDQDCTGTDSATCYGDYDGDGIGAPPAMIDPDGTCADDLNQSFSALDCDDGSPLRLPGAPEICDGIDDDCDPSTNLPGGEADTDLDQYLACTPALFADRSAENADGEPYLGGGDCFETDASPWSGEVHPDTPELCDGWDSDCTLSQAGAVPDEVNEQDLDSDGWISCGPLVTGAVPPLGVLGADDCNDSSSTSWPGAPEECDGADSDCDGDILDGAPDWDGDLDPDCHDEDDDGDLDPDALDCSPLNPGVHHGSLELIDDGVDQDCSGADSVTCHVDLDDDGAGSMVVIIDADGNCTDDPDQSDRGDDCDDGNPWRHPELVEDCDGFDNDCTLAVLPEEIDSDQDRYIPCGAFTPHGATNALGLPLAGGGDCDDGLALVWPGAPEDCDLIDADCDGSYVDGFLDTDTDTVPDCYDDNDDADPAPDTTDCAPLVPTVYPGAPESCDLLDADCDGDLVDGATNSDGDTLPDCVDQDDDNDGTVDTSDCGPSNPLIHPGASEACDSVDSDCDADLIDGYPNADGDTQADCIDTNDDNDPAPDTTDCAPLVAAIYPNAPESCDLIDSDCDGSLIDGCADTDLDTQPDCVDNNDDNDPYPDASDCAPLVASIYPGAAELCDAIDSNCNGSLVDGFTNSDGDSQPDCVDPNDDNDPAPDTTDCAPTNSAIYPGAAEACDWIDSNCNGSYIDGFVNTDGDSAPNCVDDNDDNDPSLDVYDCQPTNAAVYPGAVEACNAADDNCNGVRDDGYACGTGCERLDWSGHVYLFCRYYDQNWWNAANWCTARGYYLNTINDATENNFVVSYAWYYEYWSMWWIGLHDQTWEGTWQWVGAAGSGYSAWWYGEPNDWGGNEDCGELIRFSNAYWNDAPCAGVQNYICESW